MLKNYMEVIVENSLSCILENYDNVCQCEKCIDDIKALALNKLKPLYVVSEEGNIYAKINELDNQFKTDVTRELTSAIEKVRNNPRHK